MQSSRLYRCESENCDDVRCVIVTHRFPVGFSLEKKKKTSLLFSKEECKFFQRTRCDDCHDHAESMSRCVEKRASLLLKISRDQIRLTRVEQHEKDSFQ